MKLGQNWRIPILYTSGKLVSSNLMPWISGAPSLPQAIENFGDEILVRGKARLWLKALRVLIDGKFG
jgi:hypothetical protein